MSMRAKIDDLASKAALGKVSPEEVDILLVQILSSMYQENSDRHKENMNNIKNLNDKMNQVMAIIGFIAVTVGGWVITRILDGVTVVAGS